MNKTLTFTVSINAPPKVVWDTMLGPESYKTWTVPFCEGSYYSGSWDEGAKINFLAPGGHGMTSVIAKNKLHEFISIKHLGEISNGVEDTTSAKVLAWAPAYENFTFADSDHGTLVTVTLETVPEYVSYMQETYPKALNVLKALCERKGE